MKSTSSSRNLAGECLFLSVMYKYSVPALTLEKFCPQQNYREVFIQDVLLAFVFADARHILPLQHRHQQDVIPRTHTQTGAHKHQVIRIYEKARK